VTNSNYTDFRITHDVTDWIPERPYVFGPIARTTTPGLGTTDGYLLILNSEDKDFQLLRIDGEVPDDTELGTIGGLTMDPGDDFRIVFSGLGTQMTAIAYDKSDLNNPLGFFTADAANYGDPDNPAPFMNGAVGLIVSESDDPDGVADAATFDNFKVTVPTAGEWNLLGGGTLGLAQNWVGNVIPVGPDAHAKFLQGAEVDAEITIDVFQLGKLTFDNSHKYTLRGFDFQLETTTGNAEINVLSGSHEITNGLTLASDTVVTVNPAAGNILLSGLFTGGGKLLTKSGAGSLTVKKLGNISLTVNGGTVVVQPNGGDAGTAVLNALDISGSGRLDVNDNDAIVKATAATKNGIHTAIQADIASAQNGVDDNFVTKWDGPGLTSSAARAANVAATFDLIGLGVIRNSDLDITTGVPGSTYPSFTGVPVTPDDILIKYTYTGDGNLDGAVTFDDYAAMDAAFFGTISNLGWATGDINFDGVINFDDYAVVDQAFFRQGAPLAGSGGGVAAVPEPSTLAVALLALVAMVMIGIAGRTRRQPIAVELKSAQTSIPAC
jgi:hypothetical protein